MNNPIPNSRGHCQPEGKGTSGVLMLGEAMGKEEAEENLPFRPNAQAGSVVERAIRRVGRTRDDFVLYNVVPTHPPNDYLVGAPYEDEAIEWGRSYVREVIAKYRPRCILALGNTAIKATTGLAGPKLGVSHLTGYLLPSSAYSIPVVACFHPSYLRRGKMSHFGVLMRAIRQAIQVARDGSQPSIPPVDSPPSGYMLYPTEAQAKEFLYATKHHTGYLSYDIETPYSTDEEEAEEQEGVHIIKSIQFSLAPGSGIYLPWRQPFIEIAKEVLGCGTPKLGWNTWRFDDPILRQNAVTIAGENHDLMWAWHHLQPDIPRGVQFAAGQQGWPWPWKHLDNSHPQFYGIVDVDVLQWMVA